jgi:hypothetical protein
LGDEFAEALATSQHVTGTRAAQLGWVPTQVVITDLTTGSYVKEPAPTA